MWKKLFRAFLWTCLVGCTLLGSGMVFLHVPTGQRWVSKQVNQWVASTYGTPFQAQIRYRIPDWVELQHVLLGDQQGDTLLMAGKMRVDLDVWALIHRRVELNEVRVEDGTLHLFYHNYAFLLPSTDGPDTLSSNWFIHLDRIQARRLQISWEDSTIRAAARIGHLATGLSLPSNGAYIFQAIQLENSHLEVDLKENSSPKAQNTSVSSPPLPNVKIPQLAWREVTWQIRQLGQNSWQTKGHLAHVKADITNLNLPQLSGKFTSIQGYFPHISWGEQQVDEIRLDIPEATLTSTQQKVWVRGFGFTYPGGIQTEGGFRLENTPQAARLEDFHVHTPHSEIRLSGHIQSPSKQPWYEIPIDAWQVRLSNPIGRMGWDDIHVLFPEMYPTQAGEIRFSHEIRGTGGRLVLDKVQYEGPVGSRLHVSGWLKKPFQPAKASGYLTLHEAILPDARWHSFLPSEFRKSYQLPGNVRLTGTVEGSRQKAQWNLRTVTSLGQLTSRGTYDLPTEKLQTHVNWSDLALGTLLRQDSLGLSSGQWTGQVTSLLQPNRRIEFTSQIDKASYGTRAIEQMEIGGFYQAPDFALDIRSWQEGFQFALQTDGKLGEQLIVQGQGNLQDINLKKWAGTPAEIHLSTPIAWSAHLPDLDVNQMTGFIQMQTAQWRKGNEVSQTQPMRVEIQRQAENQTLTWASSWLSAELRGQYSLVSIAPEFIRFLNPYFHIQPDSTLSRQQIAQWELLAEVRSDPWLTFMSDHRLQFDPISIQGSFDSRYPERTELALALRQFQWDSLHVDSWVARVHPQGDSLRVISEINGVEQGPLRLQKAHVHLTAAQDNMRFALQVQDSAGRSIHRVGAWIEQTEDAYTLALDPAGWQIYYENFLPIPNGLATLTAEGIRFDSLGLRHGPQELLVHSADDQPTQQWLIHARAISLKTWTAALLRDTTLVDGILQADISLRNPLDRPTYVGNVKIQNLAVLQIPLGEFEGRSTNATDDLIAFHAALSGAGNQVEMDGTYDLVNTLRPLNATLDITRLTAQTLQTFSQGQLRDSKGYVTGRCDIVGQIDDPQIQGKVEFRDYQTTLTSFGTTLRIDRQGILATNRTFVLENFQIQDSLNNTLTLQGTILQTDDNRFQYQLNAQTRDFLATNARRSDNAFFYGSAYVDATMQIRGFDSQYQIRGDVRISDKTRLTAYMPTDEQVGSELNQLIQFVPPAGQKPVKETTPKKSENTFDPSTISLNLSVSEKAELTLIMDEITGDYLKVRGSGQMTTGLDSQGELFILGRFNVKEGTYRMTYQVFERLFVIDEASQSYITWRGNPTDADIQITASYRVNKPLATYPFSGQDLSKDPRLQRQVPFSVDLILRGDLMAPQTTFALSMAKDYVDRQLGGDMSTVLEDEGFLLVEKDRLLGRVNNPKAEANAEKIKEQAIYMLMFGRFDILGKRISGGLDAEGFARKQVSQLISDQLDRLASDIIKGVDLDVGVQSEAGADHTSRSTNLNLGVKKAFLNDRISISVGKNFELESTQRQSQEIFDHLTANYNITRDGRYRFKAFRSNQYQIEGFVVETGVGFVLTLDYDDRRDIFRRTLLPKTKP